MLFLIGPILFACVSSAVIVIGPEEYDISTWDKMFTAVLRLVFKDDSFQPYFEALRRTAINESMLVIFFFAIALMFIIVLFSYLQAAVYETWQDLTRRTVPGGRGRDWEVQSRARGIGDGSVVSGGNSADPNGPMGKVGGSGGSSSSDGGGGGGGGSGGGSRNNTDRNFFTRYFFGLILLPFVLVSNLLACNVRFFSEVVPLEMRRLFGYREGGAQSQIPWEDMLVALESSKLQTPTISFAVMRDALTALEVKRKRAGGNSSSSASSSDSQRKKKKNRAGIGEKSASDNTTGLGGSESNGFTAFHVALVFRSIESIGGVWSEGQLKEYEAMAVEERRVIDTSLTDMVKLGVRIRLDHISHGLPHEEALSVTRRKMEELYPYSQRGFKRRQLQNMKRRLHQLNTRAMADSARIAAILEKIAKAQERAAVSIAGIGRDLDGIDDVAAHDTAVSTAITSGNAKQAMQMSVMVGGGKVEALHYDAQW